MQHLVKNKGKPFLPQPKCPAKWWSSNLINKTTKNHRKLTSNLNFPKIQSRRNFRPKVEVGLCSSKNATTDRVALFVSAYRICKHGHTKEKRVGVILTPHHDFPHLSGSLIDSRFFVTTFTVGVERQRRSSPILHNHVETILLPGHLEKACNRIIIRKV